MGIRENFLEVMSEIEDARAKYGAKQPVRLVTVSKTFPADIAAEAVRAGATALGENRVQEASDKFPLLSGMGLTFERHLIGHLQENKANKAAELFDWVQSVDSHTIALRLSRKVTELGKSLPVLVEVNTSGEKSKFGVRPEEALELCEAVAGINKLELRGLMTVGPLSGGEAATAKAFELLRDLFEKLKAQVPHIRIDTLSMGMSGDFPLAIAEGSTMVRVGSRIFGAR
jgi:hypothetical protein